MRFKTGDKVEFIYRNKRSEGVINGVYPETQEVSVKQSDSPIDLLFSDKAVAKVEEPELVVVPQCVDDWFIFCTSVGYDLANALYIVKGHMPVAIYEWLQNNNDNQELLAQHGWTVMKSRKNQNVNQKSSISLKLIKITCFHAYGFEALKQSQKNFNTL